jgi:transcription antitermination factor NusG
MDFFQFLEKSNVQQDQESKEVKQTKEVYKKFKKGDFVRIVGVKDSLLNYYKGYMGEIREYRADKEHALVFLHPVIASTSYIKFPLEHLEHLE